MLSSATSRASWTCLPMIPCRLTSRSHSAKDSGSLRQERELAEEFGHLGFGILGRPSVAVDLDRPGRHGPELDEHLGHQEHFVAAGQEPLDGLDGRRVVGGLGGGGPQQDVRVQQVSGHQS